jgi:hypothetical protein
MKHSPNQRAKPPRGGLEIPIPASRWMQAWNRRRATGPLAGEGRLLTSRRRESR